MKYLPFIFLLFSCTNEQLPEKSIFEIPDGLMNQKEQAMTDIIMTYREFETSIFLYNQAKVKVNQMASDNVLSHSGFSEDALQSGASYYGQCISYNYISAESNVQAFMTSTPHRNMILNPNYNKIAIACQDGYTVILTASWDRNNKQLIVEKYSLSK